jgi:adenine/guanine phosphoribosyltransferase-like PRPP-binding protein
MITNPNRLLTAGYKHHIQCAGHLERGLNPDLRRMTVENVVRILRHYDFDAIAFSGLSGALIVPTVAMLMNKTLLAVRKDKDACHSGRLVEGDHNARRYIIVDDMISSGDTVRSIVGKISEAVPNAHCLGCLGYLWLTKTADPHEAVCTVDKYVKQTRPTEPWSAMRKAWLGAITPVTEWKI